MKVLLTVERRIKAPDKKSFSSAGVKRRGGRVKVLVLIFSVLICMSLVAAKIIAYTGVTEIKKIEVKSNVKGIEDKVVRIAGFEKGMEISSGLLKRAENKLIESRYFSTATVSADLRGRVKITVVARIPVGVVLVDGHAYQVDSEGVILPEDLIVDWSYLPLVKYDESMFSSKDKRFKNFVVGDFLRRASGLSYGVVNRIEYVDLTSSIVHTFDDVDILVCDELEVKDFFRLAYIYPWMVDMGVDRIDIRFKDRIIVHREEGER